MPLLKLTVSKTISILRMDAPREPDKQCSTCGKAQKAEEFRFHSHTGKRRAQCRTCEKVTRKAYLATEAAREKCRGYDRTPKRVERNRAYAKSEAGRAYFRAYYNSERGREVRIKSQNSRDQVEKRRARHLHKRYRLSVAEYDALAASQNRRCAICATDKPTKNKPRSFAVDHDHLTGKVRGLLCFRCNVGLGLLGDRSASAQSAIQYLRSVPLIDAIVAPKTTPRNAVSSDQMKTLRSAQGGRCAICRDLLQESSERVDHDHHSGKVRGLLCHQCNAAIGMFKECPSLLSDVVRYLENYRAHTAREETTLGQATPASP